MRGRAADVFAERIEDPALPTVLIYGHGDVVAGLRQPVDRRPLAVGGSERTAAAGTGAGTADNKGQHSINLAALGQVLAARGRLGFNAKLLVEMGEEVGSPGLRRICESRAMSLRRGRADRLRRPAPCAPTGRRSSSARAARSISISASRCAKVRIIPATGAGCSRIPGIDARQCDRVDGRRARAASS